MELFTGLVWISNPFLDLDPFWFFRKAFPPPALLPAHLLTKMQTRENPTIHFEIERNIFMANQHSLR